MSHVAYTRNWRRRIEWGVLTAVLLGLVAWFSLPGSLARLNHMVQDAGMRWATRPVRPDIVIVAIDDRSIAAIDRWPWRRALHAELIRQISRQNPQAIGMDVLLSEEDLDYPEDDVLLADAVRRSGRVVLPVVRRSDGLAASKTDAPLSALANAAARLGHVHVAPDTDGVVRSLYLREGPAAAPWDHFSVAMQCAAGALPAQACQAPAAQPLPAAPWVRSERTLIAYAAGPGHFTTVSYIDVLRGAVEQDAFRGKYVLVGAAASGLGDLFVTPVSQAERLMPGVEVVAHVLDAQLSGARMVPAPPVLGVVLNLVLVAGALLALLVLGPLAALLTTAGLAVAMLLLGLALPGWMGMQVAPAAALVGLALAYPLWSWRRLSAAAYFLRLEMQRLQRDGLPMRSQERTGDPGDFLERRINAVERASRQLRELHHFVSESLQQLPAAIFVCDAEGRILLTNTAARCHVGTGATQPLQGQSVVAVLQGLVRADAVDQPLVTQEGLHNHTLAEQSEGRDAQGRSLWVQCKPLTDTASAGWLLTLVDLTAMRQALQQRDQALHFISHDIRAPNASILTLLEMQRAFPDRMPMEQLLHRIERYAQTSLDMADSFVHLASAQTQEYTMAPLDLVEVLAQAVDDTWALARERGVEVSVTTVPAAAPYQGDSTLLRRALNNVLHNAIKFSPVGGMVECAIAQRSHQWVVAVRDQGPGIAPALQEQIFAPFRRLHERSHPGIGGVGLGLALVRTVIEHHGGTLEVRSEPGKGAQFLLILPGDGGRAAGAAQALE